MTMAEAGITTSGGGRSEVAIEGGQEPAFPFLEQLVGRALGEKMIAPKAPAKEPVMIEMGE